MWIIFSNLSLYGIDLSGQSLQIVWHIKKTRRKHILGNERKLARKIVSLALLIPFIEDYGLKEKSIQLRPWRIVLLKVTYYATRSARNFAKLCQN